MIRIIKVKDRIIEAGSSIIKFLGFGKNDIQTTDNILPYGIDSAPVNDVYGVQVETSERGQTAVIGYYIQTATVNKGEIKLYATNSSGDIQSFVYCKNDGIVEINGNADNMVRFSELETAFNELKDDFNAHLDNWNTFASAYVPGGPSSVGTPPSATSSSTSSADISGAKIDEVKTL